MRAAILVAVIALVGCTSTERDTDPQELRDARALPDGAEFDVTVAGAFLKDPGYRSEYPVRIVDFLDFQWTRNVSPLAFAHIKRSGANLEIVARSIDGEVSARFLEPVSEINADGQAVLRHDEKRSVGDEWGTTRYIEHEDFFLSRRGDLIVRIERRGVGSSLLYRKELLMRFPNRQNQPAPAQRP